MRWDDPEICHPEKVLREATEDFGDKQKRSMIYLLSRIKYESVSDKIIFLCDEAIRTIERKTKKRRDIEYIMADLYIALGENTDEGISFLKTAEDFVWAYNYKNDQ